MLQRWRFHCPNGLLAIFTWPNQSNLRFLSFLSSPHPNTTRVFLTKSFSPFPHRSREEKSCINWFDSRRHILYYRVAARSLVSSYCPIPSCPFLSVMLRQQLVRFSTRRAFSSTIKKQSHFEEGVYSNIPVKVKNRKIPYGWVHFGFFGAGFLFPFAACLVQQKKQGLI